MNNYPLPRLVKIILPVVFLLIFNSLSMAAIGKVSVANVDRDRFTVIWQTKKPEVAELYLIKADGTTGRYFDNRGIAYKGKTHYVTIRGLRPDTEYMYFLKQGGRRYLASTGPDILFPGNIQPAGKISNPNGSPAVGAIVQVQVAGLNGMSAPLATLVDSMGFWLVDLTNARNARDMGIYRFGGDEKLLLTVIGEKGEATAIVPVMDCQAGQNMCRGLVLRRK